ncbi:hypothetical protein IWW36_001446 [Coemansia brasiliensis]|uniref:SGNH hydrolase-type esterase domain-containing protein n=1 Tax=Coemansia brasiliensis TaxID=2650707 RepID=A0A9W8LZ20_9FUNG|nr:hypothetical protein IWW36_001446 [Coemansia brasiliensis]
MTIVRFYALDRVFTQKKPFTTRGSLIAAAIVIVLNGAYCLVNQLLDGSLTVEYVREVEACDGSQWFRNAAIIFQWVIWAACGVLMFRLRNIQSSFNEFRESMAIFVIIILLLIETTVINVHFRRFPLQKARRIEKTVVDMVASTLVVWLFIGYPVIMSIFNRRKYEMEWIERLASDRNKGNYELGPASNHMSYARMNDSSYANKQVFMEDNADSTYLTSHRPFDNQHPMNIERVLSNDKADGNGAPSDPLHHKVHVHEPLFAQSMLLPRVFVKEEPSQNAVEYEYPMYDVLLAFGDSITQCAGDPEYEGYIAYLSRLYQRQMDVINRGFSGYNTTRARTIVSQVLPIAKRRSDKKNSSGSLSNWIGYANSPLFAFPKVKSSTKTIWPERDYTFPQNSRALRLCIFFFGTNDAAVSTWHQHNPIESFRDNLLYFVSLLRDPSSKHYSPSTKILFITPPPVGDRMVEEKVRIEGGIVTNKNKLAWEYAQMVKKVADEVNTPYVDLYAKIEELVKSNQTSTTKDSQAVNFEGYDGYLADGIHLNSAGNRLLYNMIQKTIGQNWPELKPPKAPSHLIASIWTSNNVGMIKVSPKIVEYEYPMYDVLLAFGDSITQYADDPENQGYLAYLSRLYQRQMDVINRGFSGYNTTRAREIVSQVLPITKQPSNYGLLGPLARWFGSTDTSLFAFPKVDKESETIWPERDDTFPQNSRALRLCIFFFGTNDAAVSTWHQHNPIESFRDNLLYFVSLLRDPSSKHYSPSTKILFITPPPVGDRMVEERARIEGETVFNQNALARQYAQVVREVANEVNTPYVDLYEQIEALAKRSRTSAASDSGSQVVGFEGYDSYLVDGIHLNKQGNRLLYSMILMTIRKNWPELEPFAPPRAKMPKRG